MRSILREILPLVAGGCGVVVSMAGCGVPSSESSSAPRVAEPSVTNAFAISGGAAMAEPDERRRLHGGTPQAPREARDEHDELNGSNARQRSDGLERRDGNDRRRDEADTREELSARRAGTEVAKPRCPEGMAAMSDASSQGGRSTGYCVDRYEASLVEILADGREQPHSPYEPIGSLPVRAVSVANVYPQGYISANEAARACRASKKRLCRVAEWVRACRGPEGATFGYGRSREPGRCNDSGWNPVIRLYGRGRWNWATMNQPALNQLDHTLARTGEHAGCTNEFGVFDMVGNLHEWVADPSGTFYGGYYQDISSSGHGNGCGYSTTAHEARYHDYSTGFRCCADALDDDTKSGDASTAASTQERVRPQNTQKKWRPRLRR